MDARRALLLQGAPTIRDEMRGLLCGDRSVVRRASRFLELSGLLKEVLVRVAVVIRHLPGKVRARGQMVIRVTRLDQALVQAEAVLRPPVRQVMEAEVVVRCRLALQGMEVEMEAGIPSRLTRHLKAVRVVDVLDLVVVHLEVHRFRRGRQDRRMTLRTSRTGRCSENLRISVVR